MSSSKSKDHNPGLEVKKGREERRGGEIMSLPSPEVSKRHTDRHYYIRRSYGYFYLAYFLEGPR